MHSVITGTGCYIPEIIKTNKQFANHDFYDLNNKRIETSPEEIAEKFQQITGIEERRYASSEMNTSDMGVIAARRAIEDSGVDPETLDQIIFAHNFGDVTKHTIQTDVLPPLGSRIKNALQIKNPACIPYDVLFGCPGWLQGLIQAHAFIQSAQAKKCLVIGAEMLSRVLDIYDRDSMIFSDGAGACILEGIPVEKTQSGILGISAMAHCGEEMNYLRFNKSNFPESDPRIRYIKMKGRKVYEYAITYVPKAMKQCLENSGVYISDIKKVFMHQANEKMDEGIIKGLYKLYGITDLPEHIMPMSIHKLGNSSVATIPTLLDRVLKGEMPEHVLNKGDIILLASVGAGMNINAVCYRI